MANKTTTWHILLAPNPDGEGDGKLVVFERTWSEVSSRYSKRDDRQMENEEFATWTKEEFTSRMSEYGYGFLVGMYLKDNDITFADA